MDGLEFDLDMVVVKIGDGLGNQLYNYACGYAVAKQTGESLKLDTSECDNSGYREYMLDKFAIDKCERESFPNKTILQKVFKRLRRNIKYHVIKENPKTYSVYDERVYRKPFVRPRYLYGYWQNIRYFETVEDDIRRQFQPNYPQTELVQNLILKFKNSNCCAIHMRGQDIAMPESDYFRHAVDYIVSKRPGCEFYVFTNDAEQAKIRLDKLAGVSYKLVSELGVFSDLDEFFMISACQNQIISNSTYSRWAAVLNDYHEKIVIAPTHNNKNDEEYPSEWIKL